MYMYVYICIYVIMYIYIISINRIGGRRAMFCIACCAREDGDAATVSDAAPACFVTVRQQVGPVSPY